MTSLPLDILQTIREYFHYNLRCQGDVVFGFGRTPHSLRYLIDDDFFQAVNTHVTNSRQQVSLNLSFYGEELLGCSDIVLRLQRVHQANLLFADLSQLPNHSDITSLDNVMTEDTALKKSEGALTHSPFKAQSNVPTCCNVRRHYVLCPGVECGRSWCYFHCADHFLDVRRCGADDCDKMICPTARAPEACGLCSLIFCDDCLVSCNDIDCDRRLCKRCAVSLTRCHSCHLLYCNVCIGHCTSLPCRHKRVSCMNCMSTCDICSLPVFCPCQYRERREGVRCIECIEEEEVDDDDGSEDQSEKEEEEEEVEY